MPLEVPYTKSLIRDGTMMSGKGEEGVLLRSLAAWKEEVRTGLGVHCLLSWSRSRSMRIMKSSGFDGLGQDQKSERGRGSERR